MCNAQNQNDINALLNIHHWGAEPYLAAHQLHPDREPKRIVCGKHCFVNL